MTNDNVDIIIRGAGLSGISLLLALTEQGYSGNVLVVEKRAKPETQKTWCFWGEQNISSSLHNLIKRRWFSWSFSNGCQEHHHCTQSNEHAYCCLQAEDFYRYAFDKLKGLPTIEWLWNTDSELIDSVGANAHADAHADTQASANSVELALNGRRVSAAFGFDSACGVSLPEGNTINQYFVGAWVKTSTQSFNAKKAALMSNMTADESCFEFTYILPFDSDYALIELTRFSMRDESLADMQSACEKIVNNGDYGNDVVIEKWEKGVLPMDTRIAPVKVGNWNSIGARGNMIRASSGYAFLTIQRWAEKTAQSLCSENKLSLAKPISPLYSALDSLFLKVMRKNMALSPTLFNAMAKNVGADVFARFMTENATFSDVLSIIKAMPIRPFVKALFTPEH